MINSGVRLHRETALAIVPQNAETKMGKLQVVAQQGKYSNQFDFFSTRSSFCHTSCYKLHPYLLFSNLHRFGVCCVFVYETSGSTISQNCSYIRNPNYPDAYTDTNGNVIYDIINMAKRI